MLKHIFHHAAQPQNGANAEKTAINNRRLVLKTLADGDMSRSELAEACALRKQTLTNIIKELLELKLIKEQGRKIDGKGQPKKLLTLNADAVIAIGVHMDIGYIRAVSVDWSGETRIQIKETLTDWSPAFAHEYVTKLIAELIQQEAPNCEIIAGIGISLPNLSDNDFYNYHGSCGWENWVDFPLEALLTEEFNLPVYMENDATACAFGHLYTDHFKELSHFVSIFIGHGLGGGIITGGNSMKGFWGNAGEIGCIKGLSGCLIEETLSLQGLKKSLNITETTIPEPQMLLQALAQQDAALMQWIDAAAKDLSYLVNVLENIFDPETIIISGYIPHEIIQKLIEQAQPLSDSISNRRTRIFDRISLGYSQKGIIAKGAALSAIFP